MRKFLARLSALFQPPSPSDREPEKEVPVAPVARRTGGKGKAKKKLLPKNFEELLKKGDMAELKAVFDSCALDANDGYGKKTALAFFRCPDELARWLVAEGADIDATDRYGDTPLHARAFAHRDSIAGLLELGADVNKAGRSGCTPLHAAGYNVESVRLLLRNGAEVDSLDQEGQTPLERALQRCSNIDIERMVALAECLLEAGAKTSPRMKDLVAEIGKRFEFHRAGFNPDHVDATSEALTRLYTIFDVPPVPRRLVHDGKTSIAVKATTWPDQHQELWELLVPSSGAAATMQGEAIRISGRISDEVERNGGVNWDRDYSRMADAFPKLIREGAPLAPAVVAEAEAIIAEVKRDKVGNTDRLVELAVAWVMLNPTPLALPPPPYKR